MYLKVNRIEVTRRPLYVDSIFTGTLFIYVVFSARYLISCHGKSNIQQEEGSLHQQTELKCKEQTSEVLHLEHNFVSCRNLDTWESKSEMPRKF